MLTRGDEESLMADITEGIQLALFLGKEEERFSEDQINLDKIRLNKLQYIANEEYDLGLTFGWFKYGPAPEDNAIGEEPDLSPHTQEELPYVEQSRLPSKEFRSPEAFAYYFLEDLGDEFVSIVTAENTKEFLEEFYGQYAPADQYAAPYTDLYVASARLQQELDPVGEGREWHDNPTEIYYTIDRRFAAVQEELAKHDNLTDTQEAVDRYQRLLTSILAEAGKEENLSLKQQSFINNAIRKFYNTIWNYVALEISLDTVRGENADKLRSSIETSVEDYRHGDWETELRALSDRRTSVGLERDIDDIEQGNGGEEEQTLDPEFVEKISQAGAEVIRE